MKTTTPSAKFDKPLENDHGMKYDDMTGLQKTIFVTKVVICVCTFGFAFPNVQSD
jgi:hypothetical protein